ncbi:MAG: VWA domain-containing protein, partial [Burkholderiales bacterium]
AARHATIFARDIWRRHRPAKSGPALLRLADVAPRLDLLIAAVFGRSFPLRTAQTPSPPTVLARLMLRQRLPHSNAALPATDGACIWLPRTLGALPAPAAATSRYRIQALRQAMRALRGSAAFLPDDGPPLCRDLYLLLEARAADAELLDRLPGLTGDLAALQRDALAQRPAMKTIPVLLHPIERLARALLETPAEKALDLQPWLPGLRIESGSARGPAASIDQASALLRNWPVGDSRHAGPWLWRDQWTGELRAPPNLKAGSSGAAGKDTSDADPRAPRSARLARRPEVREASDDEDDPNPGAWMVQTAAPQEKAEDPMGLQRPTDRDSETAADEFADALSELPEARLISTPDKPKEVLISDDPPPARGRTEATPAAATAPERISYPEWDWRAGCLRDSGATVLLLPATPGPQQWVDDTLAGRAAMLHEIRRRFELLRAQRVRLHRQLEGDEIDLAALIESRAAWRAGGALDQRLYQSERRSRRDLAVLLLVDASGSTDGWIAGSQRIIDVEREALLLVCIALEGMNAPYSVQAFSGEGPHGVVVRSVKAFSERYSDDVAQRIAGLEPEHYTRAGAALRHATALLMREPAEHRLLLLLSDGKPNDVDAYEGRYGVEDMRQAAIEARLSGIATFCLTVDRQAANYLPAVFGPHHYALLSRPELLPSVLLDWLRRLMAV